MAGRFLLDTNIVVALLAGEPAVRDQLQQADEIFVPSIGLGELYFGAYKSSRVTENLARLADLAAHSTVLAADSETARQYGVIKYRLREKGSPIPENDIWIAALAVQHHLVLVTRDVHFNQVDGVAIEAW